MVWGTNTWRGVSVYGVGNVIRCVVPTNVVGYWHMMCIVICCEVSEFDVWHCHMVWGIGIWLGVLAHGVG